MAISHPPKEVITGRHAIDRQGGTLSASWFQSQRGHSIATPQDRAQRIRYRYPRCITGRS
jgi:hypothetical protein